MNMKNTNDNWYTIATFTYPSEAQVLKSLLDAQGIEYFLKDEIVAEILPGLSNIGNVELMVKEKDVETVIALMKEGGFEEYLDVK